LESKQTPNSWEHLTHASGLYAITGLNEKQLDYLSKQHGIYTGPHGRINISAVNEENVERLASAIYDAALQNP
jgi:aspartate aminotransferase